VPIDAGFISTIAFSHDIGSALLILVEDVVLYVSTDEFFTGRLQRQNKFALSGALMESFHPPLTEIAIERIRVLIRTKAHDAHVATCVIRFGVAVAAVAFDTEQVTLAFVNWRTEDNQVLEQSL